MTRPESTLTAQALYATLVKDLLSPAFRELGFKGSGGQYSLPCPTCWALLALQRSTYSTSAEVRFTINRLVVNKTTWKQQRQEQRHLPDFPKVSTFYGTWVPQARIGHLTPDGRDRWWRLSSKRDLNPIADEVIHDVREYARPWMRQQLRPRLAGVPNDRQCTPVRRTHPRRPGVSVLPTPHYCLSFSTPKAACGRKCSVRDLSRARRKACRPPSQ